MYKLYLFICITIILNFRTLSVADDSYGIHIPSTFETSAQYALLLDYDTETILFSKEGFMPMTPSSMSKLMTIYIAFQNLKSGVMKLDDEFPVSERAWRIGGSRTFLNLNSRVKIEDLLRGVIIQSGNDASIALAEAISGSEELFVQRMNITAKKLGFKHSHFVNATGWPDPMHKMSAFDLAILARAIIKDFSEYYHYFQERVFTYNKITQYNRNVALGIGGIDGLKTGHTDEAGYGLVASASRDGVRLISIVNGLPTDKERANESERLLNYGFNNFKHYDILRANDVITSIPIWYGKKDAIDVFLSSDLRILLPRNAILERLKAVVEFIDPISAPIKKGQSLGMLNIYYEAQIIKSIPLYADINIDEASLAQKFWSNIKLILSKEK